MSNKRPLILWSGGLDSSWLVYQELLKGDVDVVSVLGGQCHIKTRAERQARERILAYFRTQTHYRVRELHYPLEPLNLSSMPNRSWSQTVPWMIGALSVVDHTKHSAVMMGYVMGDEVLSIIPAFHNAWDGLQAVSKFGKVPLEFPLAMVSKRHILEKIPQGLLERVWYCELPEKTLDENENPIYNICNNCPACITHKTEHYRFSLYYPVLDGQEPRLPGTADLRDPALGNMVYAEQEPSLKETVPCDG